MVTYFQGLHDEARPIYLENFNYMLQQNEKFAAENGGVDDLPDDKRRIYEGRRRRLAALANYFDASESLIEGLQEWIEELMQKNRQLTSRIRDQDEPWKQLAQNNPDGYRETVREQTILRARIQYPHLY
jgi:hypothetical protein